MPKHKYAIHSAYLGDTRPLAWSNLGHWAHAPQQPTFQKTVSLPTRSLPTRSLQAVSQQTASWHIAAPNSLESASFDMSYVDACAQLADRLALAVHLNANDVLFDLGCGQGASLLHWQQHYAVKQIHAVELQAACIETIQQHLKPCPQLYCASFYALQTLTFAVKADVVICLDAAYHGKLSAFLSSVRSVMQPSARLGFHSLIWTARAVNMTWQQRQYYRLLLKAADIDATHLLHARDYEIELQRQQFEQVEITALSTEVLKGFADYFQQQQQQQQQQRAPMRDSLSQGRMLDQFKIRMTAKLCQRLYQDGFVDYVQVTAHYAMGSFE